MAIKIKCNKRQTKRLSQHESLILSPPAFCLLPPSLSHWPVTLSSGGKTAAHPLLPYKERNLSSYVA